MVGLVPKNYVMVLDDERPGLPPLRRAPRRTALWYRHAQGSSLGGLVLRQHHKTPGGDFLIRDSESSVTSDFSVSLKAVGKNKHFKVQLSDGVYCIGQRRFNSMEELVEHYKKAPIFTSEHGEKLYLVKALL
uniref:SH2 domain-containing protein n=1 Tax=Lates calcarifer TaxID=8187 RepID=A0A4W6CDC3_LATCA